jgi:hypothetical protein
MLAVQVETHMEQVAVVLDQWALIQHCILEVMAVQELPTQSAAEANIMQVVVVVAMLFIQVVELLDLLHLAEGWEDLVVVAVAD